MSRTFDLSVTMYQGTDFIQGNQDIGFPSLALMIAHLALQLTRSEFAAQCPDRFSITIVARPTQPDPAAQDPERASP
jgi:hypothetical protein